MGVIDDDIFEEDEYFYVHLSNSRVVGYPEIGTAPLDASATPKAVLGDNHTATVTIYDDDHAGKRKLHLNCVHRCHVVLWYSDFNTLKYSV